MWKLLDLEVLDLVWPELLENEGLGLGLPEPEGQGRGARAGVGNNPLELLEVAVPSSGK